MVVAVQMQRSVMRRRPEGVGVVRAERTNGLRQLSAGVAAELDDLHVIDGAEVLPIVCLVVVSPNQMDRATFDSLSVMTCPVLAEVADDKQFVLAIDGLIDPVEQIIIVLLDVRE